jgi:hypothetical protein
MGELLKKRGDFFFGGGFHVVAFGATNLAR